MVIYLKGLNISNFFFARMLGGEATSAAIKAILKVIV